MSGKNMSSNFSASWFENVSPSHCTTSYYSYVSGSGLSSANTVTMRGIGVGDKQLIAAQLTLVGELVIICAFDITEEVFEGFPMFKARI